MKKKFTNQNSSLRGTNKSGKGLITVLFTLVLMLAGMMSYAQTWSGTGSMSQARDYDLESSSNGILLANGKVLVTGGTNYGSFYFSSCELYDPATGT